MSSGGRSWPVRHHHLLHARIIPNKKHLLAAAKIMQDSRQFDTCQCLRSLVMGPRGLLLSSKMDWLASVRWNWPQGRRGEKWGSRPTELRRRSMADPAISLFGRSAVWRSRPRLERGSIRLRGSRGRQRAGSLGAWRDLRSEYSARSVGETEMRPDVLPRANQPGETQNVHSPSVNQISPDIAMARATYEEGRPRRAALHVA